VGKKLRKLKIIMNTENEFLQEISQTDNHNATYHYKVPLMSAGDYHKALKTSIRFETSLSKIEEETFAERISSIERILDENTSEIKMMNEKLDNMSKMSSLSYRISEISEDFLHFQPQRESETVIAQRLERAEQLMEMLESRFEAKGDDADRRAIVTDPYDKIWRRSLSQRKSQQQ
jgi:hypothetical protein